MTTETIDPALRRLLADLPHEDPDEHEEPELAEVWIPFCEGTHLIMVGVPQDVYFGPWHGPAMDTAGILLHARLLRSGREIACHLTNGWSAPRVYPGEHVTVARLTIAITN